MERDRKDMRFETVKIWIVIVFQSKNLTGNLLRTEWYDPYAYFPPQHNAGNWHDVYNAINGGAVYMTKTGPLWHWI
jgi:hypothetical protein